jgi:iron(III) transport system permease protein
MSAILEGRQPASAWIRYRLAKLKSNPLPALAVLMTVVFVYLIVGPVVSVLRAAFVAHAADPGVTAPDGAFTTYYWHRMIVSAQAGRLFWTPLEHTVQLMLLSTALAIGLGVIGGWLVARTNVYFARGWIVLLPIAYMIPSWAFAKSWMDVFKNDNAAGSPGLFQGLGIQTPDWLAYGLFPSSLIIALHRFPLVMMLAGDALLRVDSAQEEAARLLGASRRTVLTKVMLPAIRPALLSATILTIANAAGDFGVPYVLGLPVRWNVLATTLYGELRNDRQGTASVIAIVITAIGIALICADALLSRGAKRFETVRGGTTKHEVTRLGAGRLFGTIFLGVITLLSLAMPLMVLIGSTFVANRKDGGGFTLDYWWFGTDDRDFRTGLLKMGEFWQGLWNTVWVAALAATVCAVLGLVVGVLIKNSPGRIGFALRQITFLPHLLPGIALAAGLITLFVVPRGPIPALYGTFSIIIIGMVISELPFTTRVGVSSVSQLGGELEDAARMSGAGWFTSLRKVVAPLLTGAFSTAFVFPFISCMKDLTLIVMLASLTMSFLPSLALDLDEKGIDQAANGVTLVITLIAVIGGIVTRRFARESAGAAIAA